MKKRVLITNHSCSLNLGDAALLSSTMGMIKKVLGENTEFSILTNDPFSIPKDGRTTVLLDPILAPVYIKTYGKIGEIINPKNLHLITSFIECDAVIVRGGDAFSSVYGDISLLTRVLESYPSVLLKKPLAFLGHTFEPLTTDGIIDSFAVGLLKKELDKASFVSVREQGSLVRLNKLGIDNRKMFVAPDVAFQLQGSEKWIAENVLGETLCNGHCSIIGITSSYSLYNFFNKSGYRGDYCMYIAQILDKIVNNFGVEVVLLPHSFIPHKDDRLLNYEIYKRCSKKASIHLLLGVFSPELAKAIIGRFDMLVSFGRLHPIIHSVSQSIPCLGLDYSYRMDGFFDSLGLSGYSLKLTDIDSSKFMETFKRIWSNRDDVSADLKSKMTLVEAKSAVTHELFKDFLYSSD